jgi:hypothetical protein
MLAPTPSASDVPTAVPAPVGPTPIPVAVPVPWAEATEGKTYRPTPRAEQELTEDPVATSILAAVAETLQEPTALPTDCSTVVEAPDIGLEEMAPELIPSVILSKP